MHDERILTKRLKLLQKSHELNRAQKLCEQCFFKNKGWNLTYNEHSIVATLTLEEEKRRRLSMPIPGSILTGVFMSRQIPDCFHFSWSWSVNPIHYQYEH